MDALEAMHARRSIREYEPDLVPLDQVRPLVEAAGRAPSSKNTQPWQLYLLRGTALERLVSDYLAAFDADEPRQPPYAYGPEPLPEDWLDRARACAFGIFLRKGIRREDREKRRLHDRANFEFFGAKQVFFLGTRASTYAYGTFLDCGFVLNNLMVGLVSLGYASCPQFSAVGYPHLLRKHIPGTDETLFIAALPFGRAKADSVVNGFQPPRLPIDDWFRVVE